MALWFSSFRYLFFFFLLVSFLFSTPRFLDAATTPPLSFTFERFEKNRTFHPEIALYGDAEISNSTVVSSSGRVAYDKPIRFSGATPGFSTYFSFSINGGTLAFLLAPMSVSPSGPAVLKVVFGTHVVQLQVCVGRRVSIRTSNLPALGLVMASGEELHSWIDYDGVSKRVQVRLSKSRASRPSNSLISYPADLSSVLWREEMSVGLSSWNRRNSAMIGSVLYDWSFAVKQGAPYTMHSEPLDPYSFSVKSREDAPVRARRSNSPWKIGVALVIGAAFGALVASFVFYLRSKTVLGHPVAPVEYPEQNVEIGHEKVVAGGDMVGDKEKA
ncbi:L-type lectin-domain containing receptor kinase VIII.1-like [Iris pallida]|uniref:L-type lectin-domain containing receptor kinase VIII.1-like n=1 Tax=Iris pallida TaxID=29817 RepID=A0AAX6FF78_IRIPA|nr:L-type lectin-domain containing receptor kinase VIII.1-like [Iris pallida]